MEHINLSQIPNQEFFVAIGGYQFTFRLHYFRELLYCDVSVDGELVAASVRCASNGWLVPVEHTHGTGNFRFETYDNAYPDSDNFGTTCFLMHYDQDEIDELQ